MTEERPASPPSPTPVEDPTYTQIVWGQFHKRRQSVVAMWGLLALLLLAITAPVWASDKPFLWKQPGQGMEFPWLMSLLDRNHFENGVDLFFNTALLAGLPLAAAALVLLRRQGTLPRRERQAARRRVLGGAAGLFALAFGLILVLPLQRPKIVYPVLQKELAAQGQEVLAIYPPLPWSFRDGDIRDSRLPISLEHPLGTDTIGRDVATRLLFGTRVSLTVGVFAVALYVSLGTAIGAIAGYYGGWVDKIIQRIIEVVICIPSIFLILTVAAFIENRSIFHIMFIIAAVAWTTPARLVRAEFLRLRNLDFVAAAKAVGHRESTIIFREILPNAIGPVLVTATFGVASAILVESTMSFLGLGDITVPSWGQVLSIGRSSGMWTLILAPGFAIFATVSLLNLVGEGVRDALDPKLRK